MIGIIGSGNVGANSAFFLAEKGVDDVTLYDIQPGLAEGKALDMMEAAPIRGYRTTIQGTDILEKVLGCDIIIITAGAVRKPGMKRDDLLCKNRAIIEGYAVKIINPETKVIIVTEPVDLLTSVFIRLSGLSKGRIMGLGGVLDATRLRFLLAKEIKVSMENVAAQVVGRHADDMIILQEYCCVSGVPIDALVSQERIDALFMETKKAGGLIVDLAGRASAYYGPSAVIAELAEAISIDTGRVMSVSHGLSGQFGISGVALSLPVVLGKEGIRRVLAPKLTPDQIESLRGSAALIAKTIEEVA